MALESAGLENEARGKRSAFEAAANSRGAARPLGPGRANTGVVLPSIARVRAFPRRSSGAVRRPEGRPCLIHALSRHFTHRATEFRERLGRCLKSASIAAKEK